jgi:hypothetical protein
VPNRESAPLRSCGSTSATTTSSGLDLGVPAGGAAPKGRAGFEVQRHDVLGGLIHEYRAVAA